MRKLKIIAAGPHAKYIRNSFPTVWCDKCKVTCKTEGHGTTRGVKGLVFVCPNAQLEG